MGKKKKVPKGGFEANELRKRPNSTEKPETFKDMKPSWRFEFFDAMGEWGVREDYEHKLLQDVLSKIKNFETMKWSEIQSKKKNNHDVPISKLCKKARERLKELAIDDCDSMFSLRLTSLQRVYGIIGTQDNLVGHKTRGLSF